MKRGVNLLFYGLFFVLLLSFSSAQTTCLSPDDTILKLSANTNAHGEVWSQGNYNYEICFSSLFPSQPIPSNPHACTTGSNLVLRLSEGSGTNSHAQAPDYSGTAYTTDVCYGDLVCISSTSACTSGQTEILSLSSSTNAHLETAGANSYNTRICCTNTNLPDILSASWAYFDGSPITSPINVCSNNVVIARVQTSGLNGQQIAIRFIDDDDLGFDDEIFAAPVTVINNLVEVFLDFQDPVIQSVIQTELSEVGEGNNLELEFEAIIPTETVRSSRLIYQNDPSLCSFEPPNAVISAPKHRGIYYQNTEVNFTSSCTSQIGPTTNEWTITQNGNTQQFVGQNVLHTFTSAGQVNVELKCTDLEGRFDVHETQILVIASPYTLAYINQPSFEAITYTSPPRSGPYFPNEVSFSASDSFAVNTISSTAPCSVECIGGNCPVETENSPASCGLGGGPLTITQTTNSYSSLLFNWTFLDNDWTTDWASFETSNGIYSGAVQYDDMSDTLDDKKIKVNVRHVATGANADFERDFTLGRCLNNGNTYYASRTESYSTNQENSACKGGDNNALTADDCCTIGLQCLPDEDDPTNPARYSCQIPAGGLILECNDFTAQSECNGNTNPAIPLASYGQIPNACTTLSCVWSATSGTCGLNVTTYQTSSSGACSSGPGAVIVDSCSYTTTVSECIAGRKTITYNTISGGASCDKAPIPNIPCGSLSFELSFFGIRQFLISILLIGAIYLALNFRKEIKNAKK